nr:hypothetical protein [Tanacetum cinerariifolium]
MDTLDGCLFKSYYYKDLRALHFGDICYVVKALHFQVKQGIPLMDVDELLEMDPYEEVTQQGKAPPLSPAYVPDLMELDEHVQLYVLEPEHPWYHVPSDDDMPVEDQPYGDDALLIVELLGHIANSESMEEDSIDYLDEPEDDDEDPEEDLEEDHTNYPADGGDDNDEPSNNNDDDVDTDDKDEEPTEDEDDDEEEVEHLALADPSVIHVVDPVPSARDTEAFETASMEACIAEHVAAPIPPTSLAYDQAPLGHRAAIIRLRDDIPEEDMLPQRRFVLTTPTPGYRAEDVGFVRALQALKHRMMTSLEETDHKDIRLEIDIVRGKRTAYETELHERQGMEDLAVRQMMRIHVLEARAQIDTVEDTAVADDGSQSSGGGLRRPVQPVRVCSYIDFINCQPLNFKGTEGVVGLSQWLRKMESVFHISGCTVDNQVKFATCTLLGAVLTWWNGNVGTLGDDAAYAMTWGTLKKKLTDKYCPIELTLMCTKFLANETKKIDKYIGGLPDYIHRNVMSARPKTLDDAIELANDLMDQKLRTYTERQNDNKRKADDSSRNNQQQQPHKKQNVARAYPASPGEKKAYTRNLPLCTKCNYHHTGKCVPKCGNCQRYGHTTGDCRVKTNNNNKKNQKVGVCYECSNTGHIKKNDLKLKNCRNGNRDSLAQGRAYVLGGRDTSPDSNVITSTFLLNNRYASLLFETGTDRSFVSTTFSVLIDITPTTLENHYDVELADGKIIGVNTIIQGDAPVAWAPYRLAPFKMKELAKQLVELSDKGFIGPSSLP